MSLPCCRASQYGSPGTISSTVSTAAAASTSEHALRQAGFAGDLAEKLGAGIYSGLLNDLHAVLIGRKGQLVLGRYYDGPDQNWGRPIGNVAFNPETLHDLRSVTKSIVSVLYGIALDHGLVPPPDAPLMAQFREYADLASDPQRARLTVRHALTMTLGMEWNENLPYSDPANGEIAMEDAPDRFRFVLDRPFVAEPGSRWIYSGGAVALLGALIERGTGKSLPEFARKVLFEPLGISDFEWASGADGTVSAASGLRLRGRDLLKIGMMLLAKGMGDSQRIVSESWLSASFAASTQTGDGLNYGYLWFLADAPTPALTGPRPWMGGFGNGGQRLFLMPDADLAVVIFSGRYNAFDAWISPTRVWREIVLRNLERI